MFFVYVLYSLKDHGLYIGFTTDLDRRMHEHQQGETASTAHRRPMKLVYYEAYCLQADAESREWFLKSGSGRMYLKKQLRAFFTDNPLRTRYEN